MPARAADPRDRCAGLRSAWSVKGYGLECLGRTRSAQCVAAQTEVGRTERDVLRDRRHEQLVVGILENQPDAATDVAKSILRFTGIYT